MVKYDLFRQGVFVDKMTDAARLSGLIRKIRPVKTDVDLLRVGGANDGGYLVPSDLDGISECYSPGVDVNASFEIDLLARFGIGSHLADYSVEQPPMGFAPLSFSRKFVGPQNSATHVTLQHWVESTCSSAGEDLLLQMDIEGSEYLSLLASPMDLIRRFRVMIIEIHDVEAWGQPNFFSLVEAFFDRMLDSHVVVHNHPNNCCGLVDLAGVVAPRVFELTLLRKGRAAVRGACDQFPHRLDSANLPGRADLVLPENWR